MHPHINPAGEKSVLILFTLSWKSVIGEYKMKYKITCGLPSSECSGKVGQFSTHSDEHTTLKNI